MSFISSRIQLSSSSYTAFIAPVSSARLHSEAKAQAGLPLNSCDGPASASNGIQRALETPYVVRSHAASQTHSEQACWTFSHPHPSSGNTSLPRSEGKNEVKTADNKEVSERNAGAARCINNDRHVHLSFHNDPIHGIGTGCGYGPIDSEMASMASASTEEALSVAIDTAITLHGFLGSFHSVLYESVKSKAGEKEEAVISIAPSSFSTGMFSWFPLVSEYCGTFFYLGVVVIAHNPLLVRIPMTPSLVFSVERTTSCSTWSKRKL